MYVHALTRTSTFLRQKLAKLAAMRYNKSVEEIGKSTKLMPPMLDIGRYMRYNCVGTRHGYTTF